MIEDATAADYPRGTLWLPGPWDQEPDHLAFEYAGLRCELRRAPRRGFWCGYVLLPHDHRLHGANRSRLVADSVRCGMPFGWERTFTWAGHDPDPDIVRGTDSPWFVGFDCAHACDLVPWDETRELQLMVGGPGAHQALDEMVARRRATDSYRAYRDVTYARRQTELLAVYLAKARERCISTPMVRLVNETLLVAPRLRDQLLREPLLAALRRRLAALERGGPGR